MIATIRHTYSITFDSYTINQPEVLRRGQLGVYAISAGAKDQRTQRKLPSGLPPSESILKAVGFLRLFLSEIASGVSGKVGFGVSVKGDP